MRIVLHDERTGKEDIYAYEGGLSAFVEYLNQNKTTVNKIMHFNTMREDGTSVEGTYKLNDGSSVDVDHKFAPVSSEVYYIVPDKCTECMGFHEEPQCAEVCPVDCCIPDDNHVESDDQLAAKKTFMHLD
mgnify:CR=1 FL=1